MSNIQRQLRISEDTSEPPISRTSGIRLTRWKSQKGKDRGLTVAKRSISTPRNPGGQYHSKDFTYDHWERSNPTYALREVDT
jgi:hypothetical protein